MCGILFSTASQLDDKTFRRALDRMAYRGPDAAGTARYNAIQLGHRRLSIVDLDSRSNQPFVSTDGRFAITFNGEIYNYKDLAKIYNLELRTTGDTEVVLELFAQRGPAMLDDLNGMFAFVIVELATGAWFAARDRLGVKPLYAANVGDGLVLSSEPAPILDIIGTSRFDETGLRQYRKLRTFFNGQSIWERISHFPAGHYMTNGRGPTRWWAMPEGPQPAPSDEEIRSLVSDAVRIRCVADVSVGCYLSGGLDSTIVAALAKHPHTWTVGFPDSNEFEWSRIAARSMQSHHHEVVINYSEFLPLAKTMIETRREPLSVPNEVLLYRMTQEVAAVNTVVLSGEGADELFYGYDRIFRWAAHNDWDLEEFGKLYAYGSGDDLEIIEEAIRPFLDRGDALAIVSSFFQVSHLQGLLRRLDSATMLCSVEAREPFVDYRLVEKMAGVPFAWQVQGGEIKAPLKRALSHVVPDAIAKRPKIGFPVPLEKIDFPVNVVGVTPFDRWFEFNLSVLAQTTVTVEDVL